MDAIDENYCRAREQYGPPTDHDAREYREAGELEERRYQFTSGGSFILDTDPTPLALWGEDDPVLWADGEAWIIAAPPRRRQNHHCSAVGARPLQVREVPDVARIPNRARPAAGPLPRYGPAETSRAIIPPHAWRDELDQRLLVWQGPPPHDLARYRSLLLRLCEQADADTVIVDSLKDAAIGLSDDVGAAYNRARQTRSPVACRWVNCTTSVRPSVPPKPSVRPSTTSTAPPGSPPARGR
jgi:hypothetical protein